MGEFIKLDRCLGIEKCGKCIQICPISIFTSNADYPREVEANDGADILVNESKLFFLEAKV
jgi:ferredoxin